ncbi:Hypothetical protein ETA_19430 [Erwinia tasmaniensis Et1/99]|uniref:Uncharacterized protein n=1 Tax=Erwinia tasmaniensis (strain DSM 17950 / CFBP 7177 / CIP 109463 / NCPPB 4357 / Et1/99) TaxID=465817 RepID=B2VDS4_ERWT9|nr:Hypothetical protein ETA_19430 [Erwinia tasmaniensis Et1/99]
MAETGSDSDSCRSGYHGTGNNADAAQAQAGKTKTNNALIGVSAEDASFLQKHYGMIAGLTSAGDKIFGTAGDVGEKYFSAIEQTLKKIEASYQNQYRTQGTLIGQQFLLSAISY